MYTVSGLQVNTTYSFAVSVTNNATKAKSDEGDILSATTFANLTADFDGIASVRSPAGSAGRNSVIVEWVGAKATGGATSPKNGDPVAYEIVYISEVGGPTNINNVADPDRKVNTFPSPPPETTLSSERSRTVSGLNSGTKYYFQVRAIHKGYVMFGGIGGDSNYKREQNHKFLAITTTMLTGSMAFVVRMFMSIPRWSAGENNLDVTWPRPRGI